MDAEERELFTKSLQRALASGTAVDAALAAIGWADAHAADPHVAVASLFTLQGAGNTTSSALDHVLLTALHPALASSASGLDSPLDLGFVLPPLGAWGPPGRLAAGRVSVSGLGLSTLPDRGRAVVMSGPGDEAGAAHRGEYLAAVVEVGKLELRPVGGLDPRLGLVEVVGSAAGPDPQPVDWAVAVAAGQRALGHELMGVARAMLELARAHALERIQFGRPIAQFQAVRHRLAESLVAIEAADAGLAAAWDDGSPFAAGVAKALAGRSARTVARHCQQVLAGIGFTTEHPLHRYVRRAYVLDRLLGDARTLTRRLGEDLLARRSLPAILPL